MTNRLLAFLVSVLLLAPGSMIAADALSSREIKKLHKQAKQAATTGQDGRASELYEQLVHGAPKSDERRGEALYWLALSHLAVGERQDLTRASTLLRELSADYPRHAESNLIAALQALLAERTASREALERQQSELETQRVTLEAERQAAAAAQEESADESEAADSQVKTRRAQLRKAQADLKAAQAEIEKKDEALQKLKDALVGRASG